MKQKKFVVALVALLAATCGATATAQWEPVLNLDACPTTVFPAYPPPPYNPGGAYVMFNQATVGSEIDYLPVGYFDFCMYLDKSFCLVGAVAAAIPDAAEIIEFADLIQCMYADINGPLNPDPEVEIPVQANGIPDGAFELGILAAVLNDPSNPLHDDVLAAFEGNFKIIKDLVQAGLQAEGFLGLVSGFFPELMPALGSVLAGFATLGDDNTNDALDILVGLLGDLGVTPPEGGLSAVCVQFPVLGPDGDIDGDGASNRLEYSWFVVSEGYDAAEYVDAAMDPEQTPPDLITITGPARGRASIGASVTLTAVVNMGSPVSYVWYKNGVLTAEDTNAYQIVNAQLTDTGLYKVEATVELDGKKALVVAEASFALTVSEYSVPVGGMLGLTMLVGACAMVGVSGLRRRK